MLSRKNFFKKSSALLLPLLSIKGSKIFATRSNLDSGKLRVRRSVKSLSAAERQQFVDGILALKSTDSPFDQTLSYYDQFVDFHREAVRYGRVKLGYATAHETPAFLPWHRKFILLFENAIREVAYPDFTLPYWDWTDPESEDIIFTDEFMGPLVGDSSDNYAIKSGHFQKGQFPLNITPLPIGDTDSAKQCPFNFLTRGPHPVPMPTSEEVDKMMAISSYSAPPYDNSVEYEKSFNNMMLGIPNNKKMDGKKVMDAFLHSAVHEYVGGVWEGTYYDAGFNEHKISYSGSMKVLDASPNDPVFFLHHSNVDRLWAEWEREHGNQYEPESGYRRYYNIDDLFYPFLQFEEVPKWPPMV